MTKKKELIIVLFTVAATCIGCASLRSNSTSKSQDTEQSTSIELQKINSDDNQNVAKYNGQMVKGSDVCQAIQDLKDAGIAILVNSGEGTVEYLNHVGSTKLKEKADSATLVADVMSNTADLQNSDTSGDWGGSGSYDDLMALAKDESKVGFYIPPDGDYVGMICRGSDGKISALRFVWQGVPYSQQEDTDSTETTEETKNTAETPPAETSAENTTDADNTAQSMDTVETDTTENSEQTTSDTESTAAAD